MPNFNDTNRGTNGGHRVGGLFSDAAGDFSGTTALGGANGDGTVFDIPSIDGSDAGTPSSFIGTNGAYPDAGLIGVGFQLTAPAPVLSGGGNSVNYRPQGPAVAVDAGVGVSDTESATLAGATVAISAGFLAGVTRVVKIGICVSRGLS